MKSPSRWVRPVMFAIVVAWVVLFWLDVGRAQPRGGIGGGYHPPVQPIQPVRPPNIPQPNIPQPNIPHPIGPQPVGQPWNPNVGQPVQPNMPNIPTYTWVTEWRCSRCNYLIATGSQPTVISCPSCGASFGNGFGINSTQKSTQAVAQSSSGSATNWTPVLAIGSVTLFMVVPVAIVALVLLANKGGSTRPKYSPDYQSPFSGPSA